MKFLSFFRRLIPISLGSPEPYFPEMKQSLKDTLQKSLRDEFAKITKDKAKKNPDPSADLKPNQIDPKLKSVRKEITAEEMRRFNYDWENLFEQGVQIVYQRDVVGAERGVLVKRNHVSIIISEDFENACSRFNVYLGTTLQSAGASFLKQKGYNVKGFQPAVGTSILKA